MQVLLNYTKILIDKILVDNQEDLDEFFAGNVVVITTAQQHFKKA